MPAPVSYRWATPADVPLVVALVQRAYRGQPSRAGWTTEADLLDGQRTDTEEVGSLVRASASRVLLGLRDSRVVACAALTWEPPDTVYLGMICVEPELQNGGLGRAILQQAEQRACEIWPAARARMTVIAQREALIRWYERRGYLRTGEREPFLYGQPRFGLPRRDDLYFVVLSKPVAAQPA